MRHVLRSTGAILAAVLTAGTMSFAATTTASAATRCRGPQYPNGECKIYFEHGRYHRGDRANFYTDKAFKPGEGVRGRLVCQNDFTRKRGPFEANSNGRVRDHIHVPDHAPFGTCRLTLTGKTTGAKASGTFKVVRKN